MQTIIIQGSTNDLRVQTYDHEKRQASCEQYPIIDPDLAFGRAHYNEPDQPRVDVPFDVALFEEERLRDLAKKQAEVLEFCHIYGLVFAPAILEPKPKPQSALRRALDWLARLKEERQ